ADRQGLAVAQAAIAAEVHQALDVEAHLAAQVAFDLVALFERLADAVDLVFGEVLGPLGGIELRRGTDLLRGGLADPIEVLQRRLDLLLAGKVYACNTRHLRISSALPLLVAGVRRADHAHHALAADHLALHADLLHRSTDLHGFLQPTKTPRKSLSFRPHPLPRLAPPGPTRNEGSAANNSGAAACQGNTWPAGGRARGQSQRRRTSTHLQDLGPVNAATQTCMDFESNPGRVSTRVSPGRSKTWGPAPTQVSPGRFRAATASPMRIGPEAPFFSS